jgi:toxin ParE1/3/4
VKRRSVVFTPEAQDDLIQLYDWIAHRAGSAIALGYVERVEAFCLGLDVASERGTLRSDVRPGLRVTGFERRSTIAFTVSDDEVTILRYYGANATAGWPPCLFVSHFRRMSKDFHELAVNPGSELNLNGVAASVGAAGPRRGIRLGEPVVR